MAKGTLFSRLLLFKGALKQIQRVFVLYLSVGINITRNIHLTHEFCSISFIYSRLYVYRNIPLQYTVF
ncbi:hypothetical protein CW304_08835 [Bacillus sp. UFRGS-B20]|nr:hypothetical protein CW304_08835 [Bacillus sp. UFRGS-B20]